MTTEQTKKLELIVDRLLVKTQDGLCVWKKDANNRYALTMGIAHLFLTYHVVVAGKDYITLEVSREGVIIADITLNPKTLDGNLTRLYNAVVDYHNNYVNTHLEKLMAELQKLGDQPF